MPLLLSVWANSLPGYATLPCPNEQPAAQRTLHQIDNEWPTRGSSDPVTQYVQRLGLRLAQSAARGNRIVWHFSVVRNLAPNAFSIGDGYVFIAEGAINLAQNESELAAIIAHELGHELGGHFCNVSQPPISGGWFDLFSSTYAPAYRVGIGSMTQTIDPSKERHADQIAVQLLQHGGFNPHAMLDISRRLPVGNNGHFSAPMRLQSLVQTLASLPPLSVGSSAEFFAIKRILAGQ